MLAVGGARGPAGASGAGGSSGGNLRPTKALAPWFANATPYFPLHRIGGNSSATFVLVANTIYFLPFVLQRGGTIDRLAIKGNVAAGNVRFGLYDSDADGLPSALLVDSGVVVCTNVKMEVVCNQALVAGKVYWTAVQSDNTPTLVSYNALAALGGNVVMGADPATLLSCLWLTKALAFAAFPNPIGAAMPDTAVVAGTTAIASWARFSAVA